MADFCKQCSIELFGEDSGDLAGVGHGEVLTKEELSEGYGWRVLCEGCGPTLVDDDGKCIDAKCGKKHGVSDDNT